MRQEPINQSKIVSPGFESKQDWSSAYIAEYPTEYRDQLMKSSPKRWDLN